MFLDWVLRKEAPYSHNGWQWLQLETKIVIYRKLEFSEFYFSSESERKTHFLVKSNFAPFGLFKKFCFD